MRARLTLLLLLVAALCLAAATEADPKPSTKSPKKTGHPSNVPLKAPPKPVAATGPAALPSQAPQELADIASDSLKEFVGDDFNDIKFHPKADQAKLQAIQDALTSSYAASKPKTAEQAKQEAEWKAEAEIAEKAANKFLDNEAIDARAAAADKETDTDSEDVPAAPAADSKAPANKKADKLKSIEDRIASAKTAVESARETEQLLTAEANKLKASAKEEEELIIARDAAEDARAAYYATQRAVKHLKRLQTVLSLQKKSEKASKLARKLRHVAVKLTRSAKDRFDNVEALFAVRAARHATVAAKKLSVSLKVYSAKVDAREQSNAVDQIKKVLQDATSAKEKLDIGGELETAQAKLAKLNRIANSKRLAHRLQLYRAKAKLLRVEDRARRLSIRARKFTAKAVTKEEKETAKALSDAAAHNKKRAAKLRRKVRGLRSAYELDSFVRRVRRLTRRQQRLVLGIKLASSKQRKRLALQLAKTQADLDKARAYLSVLKREVAVHTAHELVRKLKSKAKKLRAQAAALKKAIKTRDDKKAAKKAEADATKAEAKATQAKAELKELLQSLNLVKASSAYAKPQGLEKLQVQIEKKLKKHQPKAPSSGSASNATSPAL